MNREAERLELAIRFVKAISRRDMGRPQPSTSEREPIRTRKKVLKAKPWPLLPEGNAWSQRRILMAWGTPLVISSAVRGRDQIIIIPELHSLPYK